MSMFGWPEYVSSSSLNCVTQLQVIEWMIVLQKRSCTSMIMKSCNNSAVHTIRSTPADDAGGAGAPRMQSCSHPSTPTRIVLAKAHSARRSHPHQTHHGRRTHNFQRHGATSNNPTGDHLQAALVRALAPTALI